MSNLRAGGVRRPAPAARSGLWASGKRLISIILAATLAMPALAFAEDGKHPGVSPGTRSQAYYAGLGVAIEKCAFCHDVGPFGPVSRGIGAPPFESLSEVLRVTETVNGRSVRDILADYLSSENRHTRMPRININPDEVDWLAAYMRRF
jgi:hypothetical protein